MDRVFDNHVMGRMQAVVDDYIADGPNASGPRIPTRRRRRWIRSMTGSNGLGEDGWACGEHFTLADCAAAPSLFYADWVRNIGEARPKLKAYRARLLARPSVSRCVEDARPYRGYFPPGAPNRD